MVTTAKGRSSEIQTNLGTVHQQRLERKSSAAQWEFEVTKKELFGLKQQNTYICTYVYIYVNKGCKNQTLATGVPNTGYIHMCGTSLERFLGPASSPEKLSDAMG